MHLVLYDDECPLCIFQMKVLTWLDWLHKLTLLPLSSERAQAAAPQLTRESLLEAMHCVAENGRTYRGARAIRFVGMRLPLLVPLAIFLWVPGVIWMAERVYMKISRNRKVLGRLFGCGDACSILPAKKREGDELK
jgi:predicted DCC family thiol-disulfide oxidoreductase YuxK